MELTAGAGFGFSTSSINDSNKNANYNPKAGNVYQRIYCGQQKTDVSAGSDCKGDTILTKWHGNELSSTLKLTRFSEFEKPLSVCQ